MNGCMEEGRFVLAAGESRAVFSDSGQLLEDVYKRPDHVQLTVQLNVF